MSGNSCIERLQAARHSTLLMCVAASQKPMQSASDLPPPPGLLGADWLGLPFPDEVSGERARLGEPPPPPVANWLGKGSDNGDNVGTVDVVVAGTPAGGVNPAEGVDDKGVSPDEGDGAAGAVAPEDTLGVVRKVVVGAESLGLGAARDGEPADERVCANAASGYGSKTAMAARKAGLGVSIAITMALRAVPQRSNARCHFCGIHNSASDGISARVVIVVSPVGGRLRRPAQYLLLRDYAAKVGALKNPHNDVNLILCSGFS